VGPFPGEHRRIYTRASPLKLPECAKTSQARRETYVKNICRGTNKIIAERKRSPPCRSLGSVKPQTRVQPAKGRRDAEIGRVVRSVTTPETYIPVPADERTSAGRLSKGTRLGGLNFLGRAAGQLKANSFWLVGVQTTSGEMVGQYTPGNLAGKSGTGC